MRLLIFTVMFVLISLAPPVLQYGVYKNEAGRWVFSSWYVITFLVIAFFFIHDFIDHFSSHAHEEEDKKDSDKPES